MASFDGSLGELWTKFRGMPLQEGDKVEGLRISKIDGDKVEVTTRPLAPGPEDSALALGAQAG